jgi:MarR family transcriptional regulator, organic hydroperoxide resistance regulator
VITTKYPGGPVLALHRATHATLHALTTRLADLDLPAADINVLGNLADGTARTVGALASATATKPSTLTSLLDRLTRRGYVVRQSDPADRRSFVVVLTPDGQAAAYRAAEAIASLERKVLATTTAAQRAGFQAVIDALTEASR